MLFVLLFIGVNSIFGQYTISPTLTDNGDGDFGPVLSMFADVQGSTINFTVYKTQNGSAFTSSGTMHLLVYVNGSSTSQSVTTASVYVGDISVNLSYNFDNFSNSNFPINCYGYFVGTDGDSWVGPIEVSSTPNPQISSVSPSTAILGETVTFDIYGSNLNNNLAFYIPDFSSGTVNSNSSTTHKTFTTTSSYNTGIKNGEIKDHTGGTVIYNFDVNVYFPIPTNFTANAQSSSQINLSWNSVSNTNSYKLYRSNSSNGTYTPIYTGLATNYHDTSLSSGTTYYYKIQACQNSNSNSCSSRSNYISATTSTVASNNPPNNATLLSPTQTITQNQATTIPIRSGTDVDGDQTRIKVYYPNTSTLIYTSSLGNGNINYNVPITFTQSGNQTVYAKTVDSQGAESNMLNRTYSVQAQGGGYPNQATFNNPPSTADLNQSIAINVQAGTDPNNDQVRVKFWATGTNYPNEAAAVYSNYGNGGSYFSKNFTFTQTGNQSVYIKTVDSNGNESASNSTTINVTDNTTPSSVVIGNITFTADAISETTNNIFTLSGNVKANNILKFTGTLTVNKNNFSISGNGRVYLSNIPNVTNSEVDLYNGNFAYSVDGALSELQENGISEANELFEMAHLPIHIDKIRLLNDGINISGEIEFPELFGYIRANVTQIQVTQSNGVDVVGSIAVSQIQATGFKLNNMNFDFDTINDKFTGSGEIETAMFTAGATVEIIATGVNSIDMFLSVSNPYPLGTTGLSLSGLNGSIANIQTHPNPAMTVTIGCSLVPTLQGSLNIVEFSNVSLTYTFGTSISGNGSFTVLGTETANAGFYVSDGLFKINASVNFYDIINAAIEAGIAKKQDGNIDIYARFNASLQIPDGNGFPYDWIKAIPTNLNPLNPTFITLPYTIADFDNILYNNTVTGKGEVGWFNVNFSYKLTYDSGFHSEFAKNFSLFNEVTFPAGRVAQRIPLRFLKPDKKYTDWNSPDYNVFEGRSLIIDPKIYKNLPTNNRANVLTQDFVITGQTDTVIVEMKPENNIGVPTFSLVAPNGDIIDATNVDNYANIRYTEYPDQNTGFYTINNPEIGTWDIDLQDTGNVYFADVQKTKGEPGLVLNNLQQNGDDITITWSDDNPEHNGQIALYYNTNNNNIDGTLITSNISEDDETDSYTFNSSNVPVGEYYVYALMSDDDGKVSAFSPNTFVKLGDIPAPTNLNYTVNADNSVTFTWDTLTGNYNYLLYYEANGTVSHASLNHNAGNTNTFTVYDFDTTNNYQVMVAAQNANGDIGNASNSVAIQFTQSQTLSLHQGWNLIGFNVEPNDLNVAPIFAPISNSLEQINTQTQVYNPALPDFLNTLDVLQNGQGYYMHLNQDVDFTITGKSINLSALQINLHAGWNLISYPSQNPQDIQTALSSIMPYIIQVNTQTQVFNPALPDFLNTLTQLEPGKGYWINLNQNCTLTF